jgi:tRNA1Val (adenine37-N6)-methyltransferase
LNLEGFSFLKVAIMNVYSQPDEYHFCQDSILFAKFVASKTKAIPQNFKALDLCAGCGVIGLELSHHIPDLKDFDFIEVQNLFEPHFESNKRSFNKKDFRFLNCNFETLLNEKPAQYDLIVANPPYFSSDEGRLSENQPQDRARFFIDSTFEKFVETILHLLKPEGEAYFLAKSGDIHGRNLLRTLQLIILGRRQPSIVGDIRGTKVVMIC